MPPIRVLFTIPNFITAGSGGAMFNIARRLDRRRFEPHVAILKAGGALEESIRGEGIPVHVADFVLPARPYRSLPLRVARAARPFRQLGIDVWHSMHYADDYSEALVARAAGARWIFTKKNMSWGSNAWRLRTALASRVVAQNTAMLRQFFSGPLQRRKVELISRGVDSARFAPGTPPRLGLRARLGLPPGALVVSSVAALLPVKGHDVLIRAMAEHPDKHLLLAGSGLESEHGARLRELAAAPAVAGRVHFLGKVSDVPALAAETDIFVLATIDRGEGSPVALLEAMASGLPCIATDVPGSQDIVESGTSGLLVPAGDVGALSAALHELSEPGRRERLARAARQRIEARYTIEREAADHARVYAEVMSRPAVVVPRLAAIARSSRS